MGFGGKKSPHHENIGRQKVYDMFSKYLYHIVNFDFSHLGIWEWEFLTNCTFFSSLPTGTFFNLAPVFDILPSTYFVSPLPNAKGTMRGKDLF